MKNIKRILLAMLVLQLGITSCKKSELEKTETGSTSNPQKFTEIKTNKDFSWSTNKKIALQFKPALNDTRVSVLKVVDASGIVYFKKLQKANESYTGTIVVPAHVKTLKYVYGGITKEFNAQTAVLTIELK